MDLLKNSNLNSKKAKHTDYARLTSIFRKLNNNIEGDKQRMKVVSVEEKK